MSSLRNDSMKTILRATTLFGAALGLLLLLTVEVDARRSRRYRPPTVGRFTGQTTTTGTRGFCEDAKTRLSLTAIAPLRHTGQTSLTNPTLVWFVPGSPTDERTSYSMELVVLQEDREKQRTGWKEVWNTEQIESKPGFMQFKLPDEVKLLPEETYIWQIVLKCNPDRPSQEQIAEAPIQRVTLPKGQPSQKTESDLWYDLWEGTDLSQPSDAKQLIQDLIEIEAQPIDPDQEHNAEQIQRQRDRLQEVLTSLEPVADKNKR